MVAVCDPKYDISGYLDAGPRRISVRGRPQPTNGACAVSERRQIERQFRWDVDWKWEALVLLDAAAQAYERDWYELYLAMQRVLPASVVVREASELEHIFAALAEQWRVETAILSSIEMIAMHPAYQRIIGMGSEALPLILSELSREPDHWFWALSAITGENPVSAEDAGDLARMTKAWLQLGRERGWI